MRTSKKEEAHGIQPPIARPPLVADNLGFQVEAARLLEGVSLHADRGELIGLIGPNGAGKTTFLRAVAGLLRRTEGTVALEGHDLDALSARDVARMLAYVPQAAASAHGFTALEMVLMGRYPHMGRFDVERESDRRTALEAMRRTETEQFADRSLDTLSGGERQRVVIARALAQQPRILLLDEPTANLDVQHQLKVLEVVRQAVAQGTTVIAAVHDLALAARFCDRLVLLAQGRVLAEGTPEEVLTTANVETAYEVRAVVYRDPLTGAPTLSLIEPSLRAPTPFHGTRAHVICGGGSGARLMHALQREGFTVTACALGAGDTDRMAADALGTEYVPIPAFGAIDDAAHARHKELVAAADVVVLCDMPIGANNLRNLEAAAGARRLVTIERTPFAERDLTFGEASRVYAALRPLARCKGVEEASEAVRGVAAHEPVSSEAMGNGATLERKPGL
jgi:iron complex transport system ATP-binding protein